MERRTFLKSVLASVVAFGAGVPAYSLLCEPKRIRLSRYRIALPRLPAAFAGMTILQIADTHHGPYTKTSFVERVVDLAIAQRPDLVVLTGDYVHTDKKFIRPGIRPFSRLSAPFGVYAVLGNHDHWEGASLTRECLAEISIRDLTNASVLLKKAGSGLCLAGVGDLWEDEQDLRRAVGEGGDDFPLILLSHNPDFAERMPVCPRVDLMISGHTHGGQVNLPGLGAPVVPSAFGQKYRAGLVHGPRCPVFVSRGLGVISPPVRFNCTPELPLLTLT